MGEYADLARRLGRRAGRRGRRGQPLGPRRPRRRVFDIREPFQAGRGRVRVRRDLPRGMPVLAKLRTDVFRVVETARTVAEAGADAVVIGNALPAALPDGRPGGLSGPAIRPLALRCVADVHAALPDVALIASGGIATAADARAFLAAGAVAVQVGTALLHDPTTAQRLVEDLELSPPSRRSRPMTEPFGTRLHAAVRRAARSAPGIDPHAALLRDWGLTTTSPAWSGSR